MALENPNLTCIYSSAIDCTKWGKACEHCGWNPLVARERREAIKKNPHIARLVVRGRKV